MVYLDRYIYIFGGYEGSRRTNDFYKFDIHNKEWSRIVTNDLPPSPRERHVAVVHDRSIFIFAGYDGVNRLNDFYEFNTDNNTWQEVIYSGSGSPPTPRHSSSAIVYDGSMYVFGGYDGNCKADLHRFNFETNTWSEIKKTSNNCWPRERYRTSSTLYKDHMYLYGGHDGSKQLEDFWAFNLKTFKWKVIDVKPNLPSLRDSHVTFIYKDSLYIHGGSSANNIYYKGDFFEYNFCKNLFLILL
jgi:leucine-zipper-like transcriptional regulator 1